MQSFFEALRAQAAGADDFVTLRAELERLVAQSPDSIPQAATSIDAYHKAGVLSEAEFVQLRAMLQPFIDQSSHGRQVPMTRLRPTQTDETMFRARPAGRSSPDRLPEATAFREIDDPRTLLRGRQLQSPGKERQSRFDQEHASRDVRRDAKEPTRANANDRSNTTSDTSSRPAPQVQPTGSDTGQRWEDPHTWTTADDQPMYEGRILGKRYQLERKLGEGGMGIVWLAKDLVEADFNEKPYLAIKVLKPDFREHPDALKALHEEVRRSKLLSHPNIVSVYTFDRDAGIVFMTMEYLDGKTLSHVIEQEFARGMPIAQAWPIIEGTGRALAYAHDRGTIHSDFKPSNVFVMAGGRAKVLDFGIARAMRRGRGFDAGSLGALTVEYASCEMLENQPPDLRDDVYAYGCVAYELLSGRHSFGGKSATAARDKNLKPVPLKSLSRSQNRALAEALAFDRAKRTGSIEEVLEGLRPRSQSKRYGLWIGTALLALISLGVAVWWGSIKFRGMSEDELFINSLLKPNAEANTAVDPDEIALLTEQGDDYLQQARQHFDTGILSEGGASTAFGAYRALLKLDPANRQAAEKILEIVKMYEAEAKSLRDQGQFKRAATLITYALKIAPDRPSLRQMKTELDQLASTAPDSTQ
jgi:serine/threonine protein kinase